MPGPLKDVRIEHRRRAMQHIESLRGSDVGKRLHGISVGDYVWSLYRPDIDGIAYYEFSLVRSVAAGISYVTTRAWPIGKVAESIVRPQGEGSQPAAGFVVVSTGPHDAPIPHWSLERPPPSVQLQRAAKDAKIARVYRLDALTYVAENAEGMLVGRIGQLPVPLQGLPYDPNRVRGRIGSLVAGPTACLEDDSHAEGREHRIEQLGPRDTLDFGKVEEWSEYRSHYADAFGALLDAHRRRVAGAWEVEGVITKYGEGIHPGEPFALALLEPGAAIEVSGAGAPLVDLRVLERQGSAAVELHAKLPRTQGEIDFQLHITYASGERETLAFFIVTRDTPSNSRTPGLVRGKEAQP